MACVIFPPKKKNSFPLETETNICKKTSDHGYIKNNKMFSTDDILQSFCQLCVNKKMATVELNAIKWYISTI